MRSIRAGEHRMIGSKYDTPSGHGFIDHRSRATRAVGDKHQGAVAEQRSKQRQRVAKPAAAPGAQGA